MPDEKPLVSVVVPVYNQEQYLDRSIPALLNQELEDIQIVAVDDGSTDDSPEILEKYSDLDSGELLLCIRETGDSFQRQSLGLRVRVETLSPLWTLTIQLDTTIFFHADCGNG